MPFTLHIGFDFWGAGNMGDDLMLAGFQHWIDAQGLDWKISALCGHDINAMRLRFPRIEWHHSDPSSRAEALAKADTWIGLGGGVFQIEVGTWILDQMLSAMRDAKARGIPAYLVGVGVNNREALLTTQAQEISKMAAGIWLRDQTCLDLALDCGFSTENTALGADTAHLYFATHRIPRRRPDTALMIHADLPSLSPETFESAKDKDMSPWAWVCQEVRPIPDSESLIFEKLRPKIGTKVSFVRPDYATASIEELHQNMASWERVLSCRFHTSLAAAWSGAKLAIFERNDKLRAARQDLNCERCGTLGDAQEINRALTAAHPVEETRLQTCLDRASAMLSTMLQRIGR